MMSRVGASAEVENQVLTRFARYIGIDYSGAAAPVSRLHGLQVYRCGERGEPLAVAPYDKGARNWCRKEVARLVGDALVDETPTIIGIDHGFSFPIGYFERNGLDNWDDFLRRFRRDWCTDFDHMHVEFARRENDAGGDATELRLCEQWTVGAKSVFHFDVQGSVAKSTHAGLPWLALLRREPKIRQRVHFWPFDGFEVAYGKSVVVEAFPSMFRRRYPREERDADQHDAYVVSSWLRDMDRRGALGDYFNPPLTLPERQRARCEGWILGVR